MVVSYHIGYTLQIFKTISRSPLTDYVKLYITPIVQQYVPFMNWESFSYEKKEMFVVVRGEADEKRVVFGGMVFSPQVQ